MDADISVPLQMESTVTIPSGLHSNGVLATMAGCNCLIEMQGGKPGTKVGELAEVISAVKQYVLAVSGVKNSGKTTLITKLLPELKKRGLRSGGYQA